jgi:hypothetical protein
MTAAIILVVVAAAQGKLAHQPLRVETEFLLQ